eukprot:Nk52_evm45s62 gene=Nk52_evmTU45s62
MGLFDMMDSDSESQNPFNDSTHRFKGRPAIAHCQALYDYTPGTLEEISMEEGEYFKLISDKDEYGNADWSYVEKGSVSGYVPSSYITRVKDQEMTQHLEFLHESKKGTRRFIKRVRTKDGWRTEGVDELPTQQQEDPPSYERVNYDQSPDPAPKISTPEYSLVEQHDFTCLVQANSDHQRCDVCFQAISTEEDNSVHYQYCCSDNRTEGLLGPFVTCVMFPSKRGVLNMNTFFRIVTKAPRSSTMFRDGFMEVRRSLGDFQWLISTLENDKGECIVPSLTFKRKLLRKTVQEENIQKRLKALTDFVHKVSRHPTLATNQYVAIFLQGTVREMQQARQYTSLEPKKHEPEGEVPLPLILEQFIEYLSAKQEKIERLVDHFRGKMENLRSEIVLMSESQGIFEDLSYIEPDEQVKGALLKLESVNTKGVAHLKIVLCEATVVKEELKSLITDVESAQDYIARFIANEKNLHYYRERKEKVASDLSRLKEKRGRRDSEEPNKSEKQKKRHVRSKDKLAFSLEELSEKLEHFTMWSGLFHRSAASEISAYKTFANAQTVKFWKTYHHFCEIYHNQMYLLHKS